jgi:hypothetical protein
MVINQIINPIINNLPLVIDFLIIGKIGNLIIEISKL